MGLRAIGFFPESAQTLGMSFDSFRRSVTAFLQRAGLSAVAMTVALVLLSSGAWADGAVLLAHKDSACYCHCGMSKARGGCVKMCEMPKYASRWWATSPNRRFASSRAVSGVHGAPCLPIVNQRWRPSLVR